MVLASRPLATEVYAWRHRSEGDGDTGAQVDLVIDRKDNVVNLCEMKYSRALYAITANYADRLLERAETFSRWAHCSATVFLTMVTPFGIKDNEYAGTIQTQITLDDLFRDEETR